VPEVGEVPGELVVSVDGVEPGEGHEAAVAALADVAVVVVARAASQEAAAAAFLVAGEVAGADLVAVGEKDRIEIPFHGRACLSVQPNVYVYPHCLGCSLMLAEILVELLRRGGR